MQVDIVSAPTLTVSGTVAATQSGTWNFADGGGSITVDNASLTTIAGAVIGTEMQVDIVSAPTLTVSGTVAATQSGTWNFADGGGSITVDNASLTTIAGAVSGTEMQVDIVSAPTLTVSGTVAATQSGAWNVTNVTGTVSLPTGAATSALQTSGNASLTTIAGAVSGTEMQVDIVTIPNVTIVDGGGSITVDGAVTVSGTVAATQSGTWNVADGGGSLTVDGTVAATQSGAWNVTNITGTVSLPTGATTETTLVGVSDRIGPTSDAAATSNTGTFSLNSLYKRFLARLYPNQQFLGTTAGSSGDNTLISAQGAGVRICIRAIRVQNITANATTILIKDGAAGSTLAIIRTTADGIGLSEVYPFGTEIRLSSNTALVANLSGANNHQFSIQWFGETTATGLPV
jgi:hypothetical protein